MWGPAWADRKCFLSECRRLAPKDRQPERLPLDGLTLEVTAQAASAQGQRPAGLSEGSGAEEGSARADGPDQDGGSERPASLRAVG